MQRAELQVTKDKSSRYEGAKRGRTNVEKNSRKPKKEGGVEAK